MNKKYLDRYEALLGNEVIETLIYLASFLKDVNIVHVNSTKEGGGVAEILSNMLPLSHALGLNFTWETISGDHSFFECTKMFHNLLQGEETSLPDTNLLNNYEKNNHTNANTLKNTLNNADIVIIHDPQPLALISHFPERKGKWIWRCHIDLSAPSKEVWKYLRKFVEMYDASIFSLKEFAQDLPNPIYIIPPSIDPFSEKNIELADSEVEKVYKKFGIDRQRPTLLQVSRFDKFKDPIGVIQAYREAKITHPNLQLILAGSGATDDPEGEVILKKVKAHGAHDKDIHILLLAPTEHRIINALQQGATLILQKSLKEGFGLTVTEALWKAKPVIGGDVGGIRLQIIDKETGLLVNSIAEASHGITYLLQNPNIAQSLGHKGKDLVKQKFLITRHLKDYLNLIIAHLYPENSELAKLVNTIKYQKLG